MSIDDALGIAVLGEAFLDGVAPSFLCIRFAADLCAGDGFATGRDEEAREFSVMKNAARPRERI